jgi:hypothetical protein
VGATNDLLTGFADLLGAAGAAKWNASGAYADTDTGIYVQVTPPSPDGAVILTTYPVSDDPTLADSVVGLQAMTRMGGLDPRPVNDLSDAIFDQLHGLHDVALSTGVHVVECVRRSGVLLGQDDLRRWLRSDNYYVTTYRPGPNRL